MNLQIKGGGMEAFVFLSFLIGIATAIYWMVVGWRAMRAHERLADAIERLAEVRSESRDQR